MAGLSDIINRISAGTQAAKESRSAGGSDEQARDAARRASRQTGLLSQPAPENARQVAGEQADEMPAAAPKTSQAPDLGEEDDKSSMVEDREEKRRERLMQPTTDPWAIAMPTGEDIGELTDQERQDWQKETGDLLSEFLLTAATLPLGGIGGAAVKGLKYGKKAEPLIEKGIEAAVQGSKSSKAVNPKAARRILDQASPQARDVVNDLARNRMQGNIPLTRDQTFNALKSASKQLSEKEFANIEKEASSAGNLFEGAFDLAAAGGYPMTLGLVNETAEGQPERQDEQSTARASDMIDTYGRYNDDGGSYLDAYGSDINPNLVGIGMVPRNSDEQAAAWYNWITMTDDGKRFAEKYPELANPDYGYSSARASGRQDIWSDIMGLGDFVGPYGYRDIYRGSGVNVDDINDIMRYLYNSDATVNLGADDINYRGFGEGLSLQDVARYLSANDPNFSLALPTLNALYEQEAGELGKLDADDLSVWLMLSRMSAAGNADGFDVDDVNKILGDAGESWIIGDGNADSKYKEKEIHPRSYDLEPGTLNPYGNSLIDQNALDSAMYYLGISNPGAKYGITRR